MVRVKAGEYRRYCDAVKGWLLRFGLTEYQVGFEWVERLEGGKVAMLEYDPVGYTALFKYPKRVDEGVSVLPEEDGLHEALHLLMGRMRWLAEQRWGSAEALENEEERVVLVLEKAI
jgi:hypothetical protein